MATGRLLLVLLLLSLNVCAEALIHLNLLCGIPSNYLPSSKKLFRQGSKVTSRAQVNLVPRNHSERHYTKYVGQ